MTEAEWDERREQDCRLAILKAAARERQVQAAEAHNRSKRAAQVGGVVSYQTVWQRNRRREAVT